MIRFITLCLLVASFSAHAEELKVVAESFEADEQKGYSIFKGNVVLTKGLDELNASKVTVFVDKERKPTKFIAKGNVSFVINTLAEDVYSGKAQEVRFFPQHKEYHFYTDVHLVQRNKQKEITGDEVIVDLVDGRAFAKGAKKKPVIMIFNIEESNQTK